MFSVLFTNLATLIITVRRNILSSLLTTALLLSLIICWSARDAISAYLTGNVVQQQQHMNAERDRMVQRRLNGILNATNGARVVVREFSMEKDANGEMVPFVTTAYWVVAPGISEPPEGLKHTPQQGFGHMLEPLYKQQCAIGSTNDFSDASLRQQVQSQTGAVYWYMCPITDLDNKPIGYLAVSYLSYTTAHASQDQMFAYLKAQAVALSGYIDNRKAPDPWYVQYLAS